MKQAGGIAELKLPADSCATNSAPLAAYDTTGLVFAISAAMADGTGQYLHLYDARNYGAGAFAELKVAQADVENAIRASSAGASSSVDLSGGKWTSLQFNQSGSQMLVANDKGVSILLDGFEGTVQRVLIGQQSQNDRPAVATLTPDDKSVLMGNEDGSITCWNIETGVMMKRLEGHLGPVNCLAANPKYSQLASSCSQIGLWIW